MSLTHDRLREVLAYDTETGVFTWLTRTAQCTRLGSVAGGRSGAYWSITVDGKAHLAHRLAWFWVTGEWPGLEIDHIDGDPLNNRWVNLRESTSAMNKWNVVAPQRNNRSGYRGVHARGAKWRASIKVNGIQRWLGDFDTPEEASSAYWAAKADLHGEESFAARR